MYYLDEDRFPADYDWLTQEQQENILRAVKEYRKNAVNRWRDYESHKGTNESKYFRQAWYRAENIAWAIDRFLLDVLNIHVEYNWYGHRNKYFLATYNDAIAENDYYYGIDRDVEGDVDQYICGGDYENE